ncbi:MAG TPA: ribbon-helix-helix protein, CopG family [Terriglobia bacterium]|nr:ribbon-helix-helix protein, CopG family [Terriglobia bacterium]
MSDTVTFRLDPETARILRELTRSTKQTKSGVIKEALRARWEVCAEPQPSAREVYRSLLPRLEALPHTGERHDRARNVSKLLRERLLAKRREGTL